MAWWGEGMQVSQPAETLSAVIAHVYPTLQHLFLAADTM